MSQKQANSEVETVRSFVRNHFLVSVLLVGEAVLVGSAYLFDTLGSGSESGEALRITAGLLTATAILFGVLGVLVVGTILLLAAWSQYAG